MLDALFVEYPNKIAHVLQSSADSGTPRELTPAFYGAYDWHSAVHGHWCLVRLLRVLPDAPFARAALGALERSLSADKLAGELRYLGRADRAGFECPYGLSWLLTLCAELSCWSHTSATDYLRCLAPLEALAAERLLAWAQRLPYPVRNGEHTQSAFALGLCLDYGALRAPSDWSAALAARCRALYTGDCHGPLHLEPSGHDFLSPCLAEADLMRRVLDGEQFAEWLTRFLPTLESAGLRPVPCPDSSDGKLAHLLGLNLSRAWMLDRIADALPAADLRRSTLRRSADEHSTLGLAGLESDEYAASHWLGSFAVYWLTRGVPLAPEVAGRA